MVELLGFYNLGDSGTETFTGTSNTVLDVSKESLVCPTQRDFFFGQFANLSNIDIHITLKTWGGSIHQHDLRAKESIVIKGLPLKSFSVVVNGTVKVHGMGSMVRADNASEYLLLLSQTEITERLIDNRHYRFNLTDHTDISIDTTTTLADPATGKALRIYKIIISSQGAVNGLEVITTDSDGLSNENIIATINFAQAGTGIIDFGDAGYEIPNGVNGLLRLDSVNTTVLDIDVIYEDVEYQ